MIVLAIGDIVGDAGCAHVRAVLSSLKKRYTPDVVIANGENASEGNGIIPSSAKSLFDSGVDVITGGNHILRRRQVYDLLDSGTGLLRPANYHKNAPGSGVYLYESAGTRLCVINLQGIAYLQNIESPFDCVDRLLEKIDAKCIIVDFHAEATAEKLCLAHHLDGRVSAVLGTHTHVQTSDVKVFPNGTGYITDLGMCGGEHSVLGVKASLALEKMRTALPVRFENDTRDIRLSGVVLDIDDQSGRCRAIEAFRDI